MSKRKNDLPFLFQDLHGKKIYLNLKEKKIINELRPLAGGEWDGAIKKASSVRRTDRDKLKKSIKKKLLKIQGPYCIYCGLHQKHCGILHREHIAPKGAKYYPWFMFEVENLCLSCYHCNMELKGEQDFVTRKSK